MESQYTPSTLKDIDTHDAPQAEYGYLFGFIPIHVNSKFFDLYDYFEYPHWFEEYQKFNQYKSKYPEIVQETVEYELELARQKNPSCQHCSSCNTIKKSNGDKIISLPPMTAYYGGHFKEPFEPMRGVRRGFENYTADMNTQRFELDVYGEIRTRQTTHRPTRMYDGSLTTLPKPTKYFPASDTTTCGDHIVEPGLAKTDEGSHYNDSRDNSISSDPEEPPPAPQFAFLQEQNYPQSVATPTNASALPISPNNQHSSASHQTSIGHSMPQENNQTISNEETCAASAAAAQTFDQEIQLDCQNQQDPIALEERPLSILSQEQQSLLENQNLFAQNSPTQPTNAETDRHIASLHDICTKAKDKMPLGHHSFDIPAVTPPYVNPEFYETVGPRLPRLLIEFLVPFMMVFNAHVSWICPIGAWNAIIPALVIYAAIHVSTSHVNTGISFILTGMVGFQREWIWYIAMHATAQLLALVLAHYVVPGWTTAAVIDNVQYVTANTGPPGLLTSSTLYYNPILYLVSEGSVLAMIAVNFIGRMHLTKVMVSPEYFIATGIWSVIVNFLFHPYFYIGFDGWWGLWNPLYTYYFHKTIDAKTLAFQIFLFMSGPWVGGFVGGSLCRLAFELDKLRWQKFGYHQVWKLLQHAPLRIRQVIYTHVAKDDDFVKIREELDQKFLKMFGLVDDNNNGDSQANGGHTGLRQIGCISSEQIETSDSVLNRAHRIPNLQTNHLLSPQKQASVGQLNKRTYNNDESAQGIELPTIAPSNDGQ